MLDGSRSFAVLLELVVSLGDVLAHKEEGTIGESLLVHGHKGSGGSTGFFEADESTVLLGLHMSGLNLSVLSEHGGQFLVVGASGETLHEKVGKFSFDATTLTSLVLGLVEEYFEGLAS